MLEAYSINTVYSGQSDGLINLVFTCDTAHSAHMANSLLRLLTVGSFFFLLGQALSPGTYYIHNVQFSDRRVITGSSKGVQLAQEGFPVTAFGVFICRFAPRYQYSS